MRINYLAVIVAAIAHWIMGAVWYGLFSSKFIALMEWDAAKMQQVQNENHAKGYVIAFLTSLVLVFVLALFVQYAGSVGGVKTAFLLWLGFVATTQLGSVIFEGRKPGLYLLNVGYHLVAGIVAGAIIGAWRPRQPASS